MKYKILSTLVMISSLGYLAFSTPSFAATNTGVPNQLSKSQASSDLAKLDTQLNIKSPAARIRAIRLAVAQVNSPTMMSSTGSNQQEFGINETGPSAEYEPGYLNPAGSTYVNIDCGATSPNAGAIGTYAVSYYYDTLSGQMNAGTYWYPYGIAGQYQYANNNYYSDGASGQCSITAQSGVTITGYGYYSD